MCYSFTTSITAYLIGIASSLYAFSTNQVIIGMLILFYSQMQLSEAIIWKGIDTNNKELNRKGTLYGKYLLATHNIAIGLGVLIYMYNKNKRIRWQDFIPLIIGLAFFFYVIKAEYSENDESTTYPLDKNCMVRQCQNYKNRLQWRYPHQWYVYSFIISLLFCWIYMPTAESRLFISSTFIITFLTTYYIYPLTTGSLWCFSAAVLAPFIVLINKHLQ